MNNAIDATDFDQVGVPWLLTYYSPSGRELYHYWRYAFLRCQSAIHGPAISNIERNWHTKFLSFDEDLRKSNPEKFSDLLNDSRNYLDGVGRAIKEITPVATLAHVERVESSLGILAEVIGDYWNPKGRYRCELSPLLRLCETRFEICREALEQTRSYHSWLVAQAWSAFDIIQQRIWILESASIRGVKGEGPSMPKTLLPWLGTVKPLLIADLTSYHYVISSLYLDMQILARAIEQGSWSATVKEIVPLEYFSKLRDENSTLAESAFAAHGALCNGLIEEIKQWGKKTDG